MSEQTERRLDLPLAAPSAKQGGCTDGCCTPAAEATHAPRTVSLTTPSTTPPAHTDGPRATKTTHKTHATPHTTPSTTPAAHTDGPRATKTTHKTHATPHTTPSTTPAACTDGCCTPATTTPSVTVERRAVLSRRVRLLVAATITYNVIEAVIAITAGTIASSTALIGFGLDSVIEVASAAAVAWQFSGRDPEARERTALKVIAVSFFALAAYVTVESVRSLFGADAADHSGVGIALAAVSLVVMPFLSHAQRRAGRELGSASAVADSKQTLLCTYLSGVLLVGLLLNSLFGWSWADPLVALVIAAVAVREGREAWRGDHCC